MSKILININDLTDMELYKKIGITNFLFAINEYSIGYKTFNINDIPDNSYILINRVMDTSVVDSLKKDKELFIRFKGIIYEDIAVFNIFKDTNLELIWFQNHFTTNYESINFWCNNGCESSVISNEITKEEILTILDKEVKPLVLNVFGKNNIMYSRRMLLSNFNEYNNLDDIKEAKLITNNGKSEFLAKENEYGTVIFNNTYFNYISLMNEIDDKKIKFYLVMNLDLKPEEVIEIINGKDFGDDGFLNKKTVYRMSEYTDREAK